MSFAFASLLAGSLMVVSAIRNTSIQDTLRGVTSADPSGGPGAAGFARAILNGARSSLGAAGAQTAGSAAAQGAFHVSGTAKWENGIIVAKWIIPALQWAKAHGGNTDITSGYRPGVDPHTASGRSEHQGTKYPHGAIDFGGFNDPTGRAHRDSFLHSLRGYPGPKLKAPIGFHDDGHCSGTGH